MLKQAPISRNDDKITQFKKTMPRLLQKDYLRFQLGYQV